jgi:glutathione S-transferase
MKLYQNPASPPCRRVLALMYQLGLNPELHTVEFQSPELQLPWYLEKNPNAAIPLLEDEDYLLWEGLAIMQYVCEKTGSDLYPKDLKARVEVTRWCSWVAYHLDPAAGGFIWEHLVKKMMNLGEPDPVALAKAAKDFHKYVSVLDQQLAKCDFVAGAKLTLADFVVASSFMYAEQAHMPVQGYSHVLAWFERISATEGWKKSSPDLVSRK